MIGSVTTHHPLLLCLLSSVTSVLSLCDHVRAWASNPGGMPLTLPAHIWADAVTGDQSVLGFAHLLPATRCRSTPGGIRTPKHDILSIAARLWPTGALCALVWSRRPAGFRTSTSAPTYRRAYVYVGFVWVAVAAFPIVYLPLPPKHSPCKVFAPDLTFSEKPYYSILHPIAISKPACILSRFPPNATYSRAQFPFSYPNRTSYTISLYRP